jgi:hypothetical protein
MAKYYVKSNSVELIVSCCDPLEAAVRTLMSCNKNDVIDEYFYVDERGMKDYISATSITTVIKTEDVVTAAQPELFEGEDE